MACDLCAPKLIRLAEKLERMAAESETRKAAINSRPDGSVGLPR